MLAGTAGVQLNFPMLLMGQAPARGSGREFFNNFAGRAGSDRRCSKSVGLGRVGSGRVGSFPDITGRAGSP